ncbi:hypothetical protein [Bacillus atrophaeus]|uniref:hypothetical protein n=1 Tax=Bacillus atrophaeus TaxID=1452 RepID=UPI00077ACBF6|nr:hypothetical protein [Bacillus atrophaeus]KXZ14640.1 hypothetical protein AXI57_15240 [Bacillus atrophaeus]MED4808423.1 hypothetical protein [Bacillus atrophaeus]MED4827232.1 hypothetical protein [Bacillus atrophaeus]GED03719.1 hypothetical protein BAT02nite_33630 [Bacillus atrophaeus]
MIGRIKAAIDNSPGKPEKILVSETVLYQLASETIFINIPKPKTIMGIPIEVSDEVEDFELKY